jgi:hypothetical protein
LFKKQGTTYNLLWGKVLLYNYRPHFLHIKNKGEVFFLDEWINVKSPFAVMLLDRENHVIGQHDLNAVQEILGTPGAELVR